MDTIAAISTAPGLAGVAVIRISGPRAAEVLRRVTGALPPTREARLATFRHPKTGEALDRGLALWFPGPASFTGEDVAELHGHGGRAVTAAVLDAVLAVEGVRTAEAGAFTRRAFENGKLDLATVEGLGDLLQAETEAQRRQAFAHYAGRMTGVAERLRGSLVEALALVEASIDFPDEGDIAGSVLDEARGRVAALAREVAGLIADAGRGERVRDGLTVAIAGPPNAGKSTLLNALAGREVAIVSPVPGTTRDAIEVHLDLGGMAVVLIDTAGLRPTDDPVEREGVRRARERIDHADLTLWLVPPGGDAPVQEQRGSGEVWLIRSQIDRDRFGPATEFYRHHISALDGTGIAGLIDDLARFAGETSGGEPAVLVRARHRELMADLATELDSALGLEDWAAEAELVAEHLRQGLGALGRLTGRVNPETVLDMIFSSFCIGK